MDNMMIFNNPSIRDKKEFAELFKFVQIKNIPFKIINHLMIHTSNGLMLVELNSRQMPGYDFDHDALIDLKKHISEMTGETEIFKCHMKVDSKKIKKSIDRRFKAVMSRVSD